MLGRPNPRAGATCALGSVIGQSSSPARADIAATSVPADHALAAVLIQRPLSFDVNNAEETSPEFGQGLYDAIEGFPVLGAPVDPVERHNH
jgi:hypothetical protein